MLTTVDEFPVLHSQSQLTPAGESPVLLHSQSQLTAVDESPVLHTQSQQSPVASFDALSVTDNSSR